MLGLPTHDIFLITKDEKSENVMNVDCSTKSEVREEVKYIYNEFKKHRDMSIYVKFEYRDKNNKVLYSDTIDKCLNE